METSSPGSKRVSFLTMKWGKKSPFCRVVTIIPKINSSWHTLLRDMQICGEHVLSGILREIAEILSRNWLTCRQRGQKSLERYLQGQKLERDFPVRWARKRVLGLASENILGGRNFSRFPLSQSALKKNSRPSGVAWGSRNSSGVLDLRNYRRYPNALR